MDMIVLFALGVIVGSISGWAVRDFAEEEIDADAGCNLCGGSGHITLIGRHNLRIEVLCQCVKKKVKVVRA